MHTNQKYNFTTKSTVWLALRVLMHATGSDDDAYLLKRFVFLSSRNSLMGSPYSTDTEIKPKQQTVQLLLVYAFIASPWSE